MARLRLQGQMAQECRRCLKPVTVAVDEELDLLFTPVDGAADPDGEGVRPLPQGNDELALADAIREEVILSQSLLALCAPDCEGLCARCGKNLNEGRCECSQEESDPRWDTLRALNEERE